MGFGKRKVIIDVMGVSHEIEWNNIKKELYLKIEQTALEIAKKECPNSVEEYNKLTYWKFPRYNASKDEKLNIEHNKIICLNKACEFHSLPSGYWKELQRWSEESYETYGIEAKVSISDFKNGFSIFGDYSYIISPKGILNIEDIDIPKYVGFLEFDFDKYYETKDWEASLSLIRKARKHYDNIFLTVRDQQNSFDLITHNKICLNILKDISQKNTQEQIFWNPWLIQLRKGFKKQEEMVTYKLSIGKKIEPFGLVVDRKKIFDGKNKGEYYKFIKEDVGFSNWINLKEIKETIQINKKQQMFKEKNEPFKS